MDAREEKRCIEATTVSCPWLVGGHQLEGGPITDS